MTRIKKITMKISLLVLPIVLFSSASLANFQEDPMNEYDSIYRYNALENKNLFLSTTDDTFFDSQEETPQNVGIATNDEGRLEYIIDKQASSIKASDDAITAIENKGKLKTLFMGNKLGILKHQMVQMKDQSHILSKLASEEEDPEIKDKINDQLSTLELQQEKVENFIIKHEDRFSLFGWFVY